jgi:flagellin-like protein
MSKSNQFLKEEDAVSPVIGVILMVAITVILAAVIAAFVFGMGPPESAPQASIRANAETVTNTAGDSVKVVKLQHQGGDGIWMTETNTKISIADGNYSDVIMPDLGEFTAGSTLYIFTHDSGTADAAEVGTIANVKANATDTADVLAAPGDTITVNIVDVTSQQMIATMSVRF